MHVCYLCNSKDGNRCSQTRGITVAWRTESILYWKSCVSPQQRCHWNSTYKLRTGEVKYTQWQYATCTVTAAGRTVKIDWLNTTDLSINHNDTASSFHRLLRQAMFMYEVVSFIVKTYRFMKCDQRPLNYVAAGFLFNLHLIEWNGIHARELMCNFYDKAITCCLTNRSKLIPGNI